MDAAPRPRSALRNTLVVMAGTLGSRLTGIVRQLIINLFSDRIGDAFNVAARVPNLFRELLAEGALVNSFIPVYKGLSAPERRDFAGVFAGALLAINLLLVALGIWLAPVIVTHVLLADQPNTDPVLATFLTRLVMPFLLLISMASIAMGLLNADEHFRESSFAPVAFNLASIVVLLGAYLLHLPNTALWLGLGWTVGGLAQLVVQLPALRRFGLLVRPRLGWSPKLGRVLLLMAPFALTTSSRQFLNILVTRLLTNEQLFQSGTYFGYTNAEALFAMANGLFVVSPALAMFPRFTQLHVDGDREGFRRLTMTALRTVTFLAAPVSALLAVLAPYAMSIYAVRSGFSGVRFEAGSEILTAWSVALVPWAINTILLRTFYARERTLEAVAVSAVSFACEVGLYYLFIPRVGLYGLGLATTLMGLLTAAALITLYRRQLGFALGELLAHLGRVLPLALLAGAVAWGVAHLMPEPGHFWTGLLGLAVAGGAGLAAYLGLAAALRLPELSGALRRLRR